MDSNTTLEIILTYIKEINNKITALEQKSKLEYDKKEYVLFMRKELRRLKKNIDPSCVIPEPSLNNILALNEVLEANKEIKDMVINHVNNYNFSFSKLMPSASSVIGYQPLPEQQNFSNVIDDIDLNNLDASFKPLDEVNNFMNQFNDLL